MISEETRSRLRSSHLGKIPWNRGLSKKIDPRVAKMSESLIGKFLSEEHKEKIRLSKLGKHHNHRTSNGKTWKCSEETMEKRRESFNPKVIENLTYRFPKGHIPWSKGIPSQRLAERNRVVRMIGEKHWNWQGGKTPINRRIRRSVEFKIWRNVIFQRDNFTCQECGVKGRYLHPHHIKSFACFPLLRFDLNNGITLCLACHARTDTYLKKVA